MCLASREKRTLVTAVIKDSWKHSMDYLAKKYFSKKVAKTLIEQSESDYNSENWASGTITTHSGSTVFFSIHFLFFLFSCYWNNTKCCFSDFSYCYLFYHHTVNDHYLSPVCLS